jgi:two-component system, sensor histidine kinase and response regulator
MNNDSQSAEVSKLRGEIESLRIQIDRLQDHAKELGHRNKELQEQVFQLRMSNDELLALQTTKDDLFAQIIHDIKNPAAIIKSLVELLTTYDLKASEQQDIIKDIVTTSSRILKLSQEVSRVMALESNRIPLDLMEAPINEIVKDILRLNTPNAEKKNIKMMAELGIELPDIMMDPQKISEVIENMISNAIKFTMNGGMVKIKTFEKENYICIEVIDTGIGLTQDDIQKAFQKGARLSAKPTGGESSSGLGLWIIKKLVEVHKGKVWIKSALGKGSTFGFNLPIIKEDAPGK